MSEMVYKEAMGRIKELEDEVETLEFERDTLIDMKNAHKAPQTTICYETPALYITVQSEGKHARTKVIKTEIMIDIDEEGYVRGIEILPPPDLKWRPIADD